MKDYANTDHLFLQLSNGTLGVYNCWDAYNTARLAPALLQELRSNQQLEFFEQVTMPLQEAVVAMQARGMGVSKLDLQSLRTAILGELHEVDSQLKLARGSKLNLDSDQQVSRWLFDDLGLKAPKRTEKGHRSVDQEALVRCLRDLRVMDEPHRQVLYDLLHRSRLTTIRDRYLNFHIDPDQRVRPTVKMASTKTTRFAYADPALQQFPQECRFVFVPAAGHLYLSADYSQLEARILFHYAQDRRALEQLADPGGDIHRANALDLFALSPEAWASMSPPERKAHRNYAKTFLYRKLYGGTALSGDKKLTCPCPRTTHTNPDLVKLTPGEARGAESRWDARHPEIQRWYGQLFKFVRDHHYFEPLLGSRRYLFAPLSADLERELRNAPMQIGAAQLMQRAQVQLHRKGAPIVLQHHDAFVLEVREGQEDYWAQQLRSIMEQPVDRGPLEGTVFPIDLMVGHNWGDWSPSNPRGLKKWQLTTTPTSSSLA